MVEWVGVQTGTMSAYRKTSAKTVFLQSVTFCLLMISRSLFFKNKIDVTQIVSFIRYTVILHKLPSLHAYYRVQENVCYFKI